MTIRQAVVSMAWLAGLALTPAASAQTLTRGPILGKVAGDRVVVRFEIDAPSAVEVRHGPTDAYGAAEPAGSGTVFEVELRGLAPGETVHYRPFAGATPLGEDHAFRTAPPPRAPFRFLVFGDTRSGHDAHRGIIAGILPHEPWFGVHTGDLVSSGDDPAGWVTFFEIEAPLLSDVPLFAAAGNHEDSDVSSLYVDNLPLPDDSPGPELYYSWDHGNVHGIVLDQYVHVDSELLCIVRIGWWQTCFNAAQNAWLAADLAAAAANPDIDHVFVFVHEGPYSSKAGRDGSVQMRVLLDTFLAHGVRVLFSGHDHYYERGFAGNGLPYVVTGGGGAPLYAPDTPTLAPHTVEVAEMVHHFVIVDIDGLDATLTTYRLDGSILDTFSYAAPPRPCFDPAFDCGTLPPDCAWGRWICDPDVCVAVDCAGGPDADGDGDDAGPDADADGDDVGPDADADAPPLPDAPGDAAPSDADADVEVDAAGGGCSCRAAGRAGGTSAAAVLIALVLRRRRR